MFSMPMLHTSNLQPSICLPYLLNLLPDINEIPFYTILVPYEIFTKLVQIKTKTKFQGWKKSL